MKTFFKKYTAGFMALIMIFSLFTTNISASETVIKPLKPTEFTTTSVTETTLNISWNAIKGADGYEVYRFVNGKSVFYKDIDNGSTSFNNAGKKIGTTYYYKVRSYIIQDNKKIYSWYSNLITHTMADPYAKPLKPSNVVAKAFNCEEINLSWDKVDGVDGYEIYRFVNGKSVYYKTVSADTTSLINKGKKPETTYQYKIRSFKKVNGKTIYSWYTSLVSGTTLLKGVDISWIDPEKPVVALTFDDGPGYGSSDVVYEYLKETNTKATFFILGMQIPGKEYKIKRLYDMGCLIANHTYSHYDLTNYSASTIRNEEQRVINMLDDIGIDQSRYLVRVPYGALSGTVKSNISAPIIQWSVDSIDWNSYSESQIMNNIGTVEDGDIILMHEIHMLTANTLDTLIPKLKSQGFQFVTVEELYALKGYDLQDGQVYFHG